MVNALRDDQTCAPTALNRGQTVGLLFTVESGFLSVLAVLLLFSIIIRNIRRHRRNSPGDTQGLFRSPLDVYMLSLFISDLIQGIGIVLSTHWVVRGTIQCGPFCTAQGVIQQLGETTVALATLAIAVHTFITIFFRKLAQGLLVPTIAVSAIWLYVVLVVAITTGVKTEGTSHFDTPTPYWCWILNNNRIRIGEEYFWFWCTAIVSAVLYLLIFFCLRGNIMIEDKGWGIRFRSRPTVDPLTSGIPPISMDQSITNDVPRYSLDAAKKAFSILVYPIAYIVLILPLSVVRFAGADTHPAAIFVSNSIFGLSGVVNVTLILLTRPGLLLLSEPAYVAAPPSGPFFGSAESVVVGGVSEEAVGSELVALRERDVGGGVVGSGAGEGGGTVG